MAKQLWVTNVVATAMANALLAQIDAGTAAVINIHSGTAPADADAALGSNPLLAQLTCSATFGSVSTSGNNARITLGAVNPDSSADNTGTATFFRVLTQSGGATCLQGTVGTTDADLVLNTVAITAGSTVSVTSGTIDIPEG